MVSTELAVATCMVKRSETVNLGGLWLEGHGLSVASETLGLFPRVRRAAPSLPGTQSSYGLAKSAH